MLSSEKLGERIAQVRKRRNLTQAELAERIGVARTTVVAMEKGERRPSNTELMRLSQALSITVNELLREHTVLAEASPRFRMGNRRAADNELNPAMEQLKRLGAQYTELERLLGLARVPAPLESVNAYRAATEVPGMDPRLAGQDAAGLIRRSLGLGDGPALALEERLELEAGLRIFHLDLPNNLAAALLWSDEMGACVALNWNHPYARQRWSLVHELGHFLRDREAGDLLPARLEGKLDPAELFCEHLAREFLMPAAGLRRRFAEHLRDKGAHFSPADLIALARFYDVSFQAMALRLEELGLLPVGTYDKLRLRNFKPKEAERTPGTQPVKTRPGYWLPPRHVRLALEAYEGELLSEGELAEYLHCDRITARGMYLARRTQVLDEGGELVLNLAEDILATRSPL